MQSFWGALAAATSDVDVARQDWRDTVALRGRLDTTIVPLKEEHRVGEQATMQRDRAKMRQLEAQQRMTKEHLEAQQLETQRQAEAQQRTQQEVELLA